MAQLPFVKLFTLSLETIVVDQEQARRDIGPKAKRQSKPKPRKFFSISPDFVRGGAPGFELENEDKLRNGRTALEHVPWRPGFPEFPETPRFLFDKKLGRPVRDLEQYGHYWLVSDRAKQVLEIIDPDGVVFLKCDVHSRDGEPGPTYWLCDKTRILEAVDEEASIVKIDDVGTGKYYSLVGSAKLILKEDVVGSAHFFRLKYMTPYIICDASLKEACKAAGLKGVRFQGVENL